MATEYDVRRFTAIAESLGFRLLIGTNEGSQGRTFVIQHEPSNTEVLLDENNGMKVLDFLNTARWASVSQALEARIAKLETLLVDTNRGVRALSAQDQYQYYLKRFQDKIPVFESYGLKLTINKQAQEAVYQNGCRRPVHCPINQAGYNRALRLLNHAKNKRKQQEQKNDRT